MSRRRSVMSENFKYELAKDLGFYDVVQREGWSGIRTQDAGNMVKRAIQIAQEHLAKQYVPAPTQTPYSASTYRQPSVSQPPYNGQGYAPNYNTNQQQAVTVNHLVPGYQQTGQGVGRPYYS
jgi:hypothetical protein